MYSNPTPQLGRLNQVAAGPLNPVGYLKFNFPLNSRLFYLVRKDHCRLGVVPHRISRLGVSSRQSAAKTVAPIRLNLSALALEGRVSTYYIDGRSEVSRAVG